LTIHTDTVFGYVKKLCRTHEFNPNQLGFHPHNRNDGSVSLSSVARFSLFPILCRSWNHLRRSQGVCSLNLISFRFFSFFIDFLFSFWGLIYVWLGIVFVFGNWSFFFEKVLVCDWYLVDWLNLIFWFVGAYDK